ncbi:hypothetical protein P879_09418 [Paragonimus westermani]|uniref:Uncharacterized protein n=1 Tax=Paragonimus westermani TaxID=34504 RepID=A0A8T0DA09_9TREM|nr:hypothetical protein P879_09418 [Paragonimus westermani]
MSSCVVRFGYNKEVLGIACWHIKPQTKNQEHSDKPALRSWSSRSLCWKPEKMDHPLRGKPNKTFEFMPYQETQQTGVYPSRSEDCGNKIAGITGGDYIRAFINMIILIFIQLQNKLLSLKPNRSSTVCLFKR